MQRLLRQPRFVIVFLVPLLLLGFIAFKNVGSGFMPVMDEGGFILDYISPPGTSLAETDRLLRQVESVLQETPEVQTYSRRTGLQLGGGVTEANIGDFFVRLKPFPRRGIEEVMNDVREEIEKHIPGLQVELLQLMEDLIGDLTAVPQPIEIKLYSDDEQLLRTLPPKVADTISKVRGVVEVKNGIIPAGDALNIQVDRVKVGLEGMDPEAVTKALNDFLSGNVTTHIQQGPKLIGVRVWIPRDARETMRNIDNLLLRAPDGHLFPLKRVATLIPVSGEPEIMRDDLKRMVAVTARISGRDLGSTVSDVKRALARSGVIPNNVLYTFGGLYEQQQIAFRGLTIILIAAILLVFLLLLFLYESFRVAFAMLLVPLFAVAGVFFGLWVTGTEFNITSRMGMTMIVGIVTEIAIFYYSEFRSLPASDDRLILAGIKSDACDLDDGVRCYSCALATGAWNRARLRHAATARHRDYLRTYLFLAACLNHFARVAGNLRSESIDAIWPLRTRAVLFPYQLQDTSFSWINQIRCIAVAGHNPTGAFGSRDCRLQMKFSVDRPLQQWSMSPPATLRRKEVFRPLNNRCCPDPDPVVMESITFPS